MRDNTIIINIIVIIKIINIVINIIININIIIIISGVLVIIKYNRRGLDHLGEKLLSRRNREEKRREERTRAKEILHC